MKKKYVILAFISLIFIGYMDAYFIENVYFGASPKQKNQSTPSIELEGVANCDVKNKQLTLMFKVKGISPEEYITAKEIKAIVTLENNNTFICKTSNEKIRFISSVKLNCDKPTKGWIKDLEVYVNNSSLHTYAPFSFGNCE